MKKILTSLVCCLIVSHVAANNRTERQMKEIAEKKIAAVLSKKATTRSSADMLRIINKPTLAVYSDGNGFAIISRNDSYPALLAYGAGSFDEESLPANVKWWFDAVQHAMDSGRLATRSVTRAGVKEIKPLLTTKWGQSSPFNNYAPSLKLYNGQKAPAGCVAIAMAQCLNFQKYPASAEFEGHYYQEGVSDEVYQGNVSSTYSWPYKDFYRYYYPEGSSSYVTVSSSPLQGNMVATLCRDCAYSIDMQYTMSGSGAYTFDVPDALINRFNYPATAVRFYDRRFYSTDEWRNLVYGELEMGNPFIYSGSTAKSGGHAFVADGCDSEGLIHFNWGWSGYCDGYYAMDVLTPDDDDFSDNQEIVTGIRPNIIDTDVYGSLVCTGQPFEFSFDVESKKLWFKDYGLYNYGGKTVVGKVAVVFECLTNPENTDYIYYMSDNPEDFDVEELTQEQYTLPPYYGWRPSEDEYQFDDFFPEGEYRVYFASKDQHEDSWQIARTYGGTFYYNMTVDASGNVTVSDVIYSKGEDTSIRDIKSGSSPASSSRIYNLRGHSLGTDVSRLGRGLYIIGGKKVVK